MIEKISCGFVYLHLSDQVNATDAVWYCGTIIFLIFFEFFMFFLLFLYINIKNKILKIYYFNISLNKKNFR